jgi:hypothetical protein
MQIKNICLLSVASGEISAVEDFTYDMTVATLDAPRSQKGHGVDSSKSAGLLPSRTAVLPSLVTLNQFSGAKTQDLIGGAHCAPNV